MSIRIGSDVRRKEDLRLVTGAGCFSDDVNLPGQAYAVMVRSPHAHARIRSIDTDDGARRRRRARGAHRRRPAGGRAEADPAPAAAARRRPTSRCATATAATRRPRRTIRCPPTRSASSAKRWRWWSPRRSPRPSRAPSASPSTTSRSTRSRARWRRRSPARRPCSRTAPNICVDAERRRRRRHRSRVRARRARRRARHLGAARHRRADGAARRGRRLRCPRPAATRCTPAAAAWCGRRRELAGILGVGGEHGARDRARRRRQFRHPQRVLSGIRAGVLGGAAARPAGEVDLRARGILPQRLPGPRPRGAGRAGARRRRQFPGAARRQHQQCRRPHRELRRAGQGRRADVERLQDPGRAFPRPRGADQHAADQFLSQRRPARGDVRDRAADRPRRARNAASTACRCGGAISCRSGRAPTSIRSA